MTYLATEGAPGAAEHYERLLAEHYTWMAGGFAAKAAEQRALLAGLGLPPAGGGRAVDLGCGPGFQSIALAELGYRVTAVDTSRRLLSELAEHKGRHPIEMIEADLCQIASLVAPGIALAVCMGDTLTHLPSKAAVLQLFADVRRTLRPGGHLVISYRDLTAELTGVDRFIPVRSDADRIMTCFLEYEAETVLVHDLIHRRAGAGWHLGKSSYRKLRLARPWIEDRLSDCGLPVRRSETVGGLSVILAEAGDR